MSKAAKKKARRKPSTEPANAAAGSSFRPGNGNWMPAAFLVLATFLAYLPVWRDGFIWDDGGILAGDPNVHGLKGLFAVWFSPATPDYYPITSSLLLLERGIWGAHPLGYHLVNVILHAGSAVLWWRILLNLKIPGAWLAAAIFALHPVNVESVAWIAEQKNTLAMLFYGAALLYWLRFEETGSSRWYELALAAFGLSLLSKTAGSPLPLVLLGLSWWRRGRIDRIDLVRVAPFFALAAILALVTIWFQAHQAIGDDVVRTDGFWARLAGAGWAIWFYLYKALWPAKLLFVYRRWPIDIHSPWTWAPLLLLIVAFAWFWRRRRSWGRPWLFALGYYVLLLLPIVGFINIYFMRYSLVADHWQYFAIIAPIAMAAAGIRIALVKYWTANPVMALAVPGALVVVLAGLTWNQNQMYENVETLWRTTLEKNPDSLLAQYNLGEVLLGQSRPDEASEHFQAALELDPDNPEVRTNLGVSFVQERKFAQAIEQFQRVLVAKPKIAEAHSNLAIALADAGRTEEAVEQYRLAVEYKPDSFEYHRNLARALDRLGKKDEAAAQLEIASKIGPDHVESNPTNDKTP